MGIDGDRRNTVGRRDVAQVLAREGNDWREFRSRFAGAVGIPLG